MSGDGSPDRSAMRLFVLRRDEVAGRRAHPVSNVPDAHVNGVFTTAGMPVAHP
jgi:hypothetical protein